MNQWQDARRRTVALATAAIVTGLFAMLSLLSKVSCLGQTWSDFRIVTRNACYSDVQALWLGRSLGMHLPPYSGHYDSLTHHLTPGVVEYPTLSGLFIWATSSLVSTESAFLVLSAVLLGIAAIAVTTLLARVWGRRAWIWAAAPALILYTSYNWDVLPVLCSVAAFVLVLHSRSATVGLLRLGIAGALLGVGGALKLYPLLFVIPLVLWILFDHQLAEATKTWRRRAAGVTFAAACVVVLVSNVPFMIANFSGWAAAFQFQAIRPIDATTLSVWNAVFSHFTDTNQPSVQRVMMTASTAATAIAIVAIVAVATIIAVRKHRMRWIGVSAALLCAYLLFNKVHSPQYVLWLIPFFVVLRLRMGWIIGYFIADIVTFFGWYRWNYYALMGNVPRAEIANDVLMAGVISRIVLLIVFIGLMPRLEVAPMRRRPGAPVEGLREPMLTRREALL